MDLELTVTPTSHRAAPAATELMPAITDDMLTQNAAGIADEQHQGPFTVTELPTAAPMPRHALSTHLSLTNCTIDLPTSYTHTIRADPGPTGQTCILHATSMAGITLSLRILASPADGDYWQDTMINATLAQATAEYSIHPGATVSAVPSGYYGPEIHVSQYGVRRIAQIGVSRPHFTTVIAVHTTAPNVVVSDVDIQAAYQVMSTLSVRPLTGPAGATIPL